jgi:3-oxoadipate enol-lactonase
MAFTTNQGVKIYWDEQGKGEPLLMIMGMAYASAMWNRIRPLLNVSFQTIVFDNRGIGHSDVPPGPYPIPLMASDAAAVLDAAKIESAHVFGVSMGGMIAQEFAIQYPRRVRSLILGCTTVGGEEWVQADPAVQEILKSSADLTPEQLHKAIRPYVFDPGTAEARIDEDFAIRLKWLPTPAGHLAQLQGIMMWGGSYNRLSQIAAPTLVIHGERDKLIPPENGKMIAERIKGAKLVVLPHASHVFMTDQTEAAYRAIIDFLQTRSSEKSRAALIQNN